MHRLLALALLAWACAPGSKVDGGGDPAPAASPDAGPGMPDAGPGSADAGTTPAISEVRQVDPDAPYPGAGSPTLLDSGTKTLLAVSPDGLHAVVSNEVLQNCTNNPHSGPPCDATFDIPLRLVTAGVGSIELGFSGRSADFSGDGRFLFVGSFAAHADGTGLRQNPPYSPVGRWLYSRRGGDLYRQPDLDGDPSLVLAGGGDGAVSPDGESIAYCSSSGSCFMQTPIGAAPLPIPSGTLNWGPEGRWLFVPPCTFVELTGKTASVCDAIAPGTWAQRTGDKVAFVSAASGGVDLHVRNLDGSPEVVFAGGGGYLSTDGSKVLRGAAESSDPAGPVTLLEAPSSGGPWTTLGSGISRWSVSDDSRFVGMAHLTAQPLLSVDGTAGVAINVPGLDLSGGLAPMFESPGGFGKAIFYEWDPGRLGLHSVIGNADGSGDWMRMPLGADCLEWRGHTALCFNGNDLYAVRGEQAGALTSGVSSQGVKGYFVAPAAAKILFVLRPAGLWSAGIPGP